MEHSRKYRELTSVLAATPPKEEPGSCQSPVPLPTETSSPTNWTTLVVDDKLKPANTPRSIAFDQNAPRIVQAECHVKSPEQELDSAVGKLKHYCDLINSLLVEVDSADYEIEKNVRLRIRHDIFSSHVRERRHLRILYGEQRWR